MCSAWGVPRRASEGRRTVTTRMSACVLPLQSPGTQCVLPDQPMCLRDCKHWYCYCCRRRCESPQDGFFKTCAGDRKTDTVSNSAGLVSKEIWSATQHIASLFLVGVWLWDLFLFDPCFQFALSTFHFQSYQVYILCLVSVSIAIAFVISAVFIFSCFTPPPPRVYLFSPVGFLLSYVRRVIQEKRDMRARVRSLEPFSTPDEHQDLVDNLCLSKKLRCVFSSASPLLIVLLCSN